MIIEGLDDTMKDNRTKIILFAVAVFLMMGCCNNAKQPNEKLLPPEVGGLWVQPGKTDPSALSPGKAAQPVWGHANGIRVGISPLRGPRGLLRIYTPYLGHQDDKMINYIAFEPVVAGQEQRGFSELEMSTLDDVRGKRFWSSNDSLSRDPLPAEFPVRGVIERPEASGEGVVVSGNKPESDRIISGTLNLTRTEYPGRMAIKQ